MARAKRYQGGSILSFIIVTAAIAALLVGGIVWLRHRGEVARQERSGSDIAQQQTAESGDETSSTEGSSEGAASDSSTSETTDATDQSTTTGTTSDDEQESADAASGSSTTSSSSETAWQSEAQDASSTGVTSSPSSLPETGPAELVGSFVVIAIISYVSVRYAVSRRELVSTL